MTKPAEAAYTILPRVPPPSGDRPDARWKDAVRDTVALWSFVLLMNLPAILHLHAGQGARSVVLDCSTILLSMALALAVFALFRAVQRVAAGPRFVLLALAVVAVAIVQAAFDLLFTDWIAQTLESGWRTMATDLRRGYGAALNYAGVFAVNLALFQIATSRRATRRQERRLAALGLSRQAAELQSLRAKLDPHFLFNTLNSLSGLVVTRRNEEAERLIGRLSTFLRSSLAADAGRLVAAEDEFALAEHYARIEETRFGDRLAIDVACAEDAARLAIPALTVQPLVERAVRDLTAESGAPIHLRVAARLDAGMLVVTVAHDAPRAVPRDAAEIDHLRRRIHALCGEASGVEVVRAAAETTTRIVLPARAIGD